jgi:hypothetical protein
VRRNPPGVKVALAGLAADDRAERDACLLKLAAVA